MKHSDSTAKLSVSSPEPPDPSEDIIAVSLKPMPATYNVTLKGRQENLTRKQCLELYRRLLDVLVGELESRCEVVKKAVAINLGVPVIKINSTSRREYIVVARHAFVYLAANAGVSRFEIAESLNRSYSAILYSIRDFKILLARDPKLREQIAELEVRVKELIQ